MSILKSIKNWLTIRKPKELYLVVKPERETSVGFRVLVATYELQDAVDYMNHVNQMNKASNKELVWMTKTAVL